MPSIPGLALPGANGLLKLDLQFEFSSKSSSPGIRGEALIEQIVGILQFATTSRQPLSLSR